MTVLPRWMHQVSPQLVLALGAVLLTAACATEPAAEATAAAAPAAAPAGTAAVASNEEPEIICRNEAVTGTVFKRRVCMTQAEWNASQRGQRRQIEEMARRNRDAAGVGAATQNSGPPTATFP
jgi:hypothetical protein